MTSPQPLVRRTASDQVAHEVRRRIWTGELRAGDRLAQDELAKSMGVSRVPVREALITLTHEGAVRSTPHMGSFVETMTEQSVADHYALYAHIDGFAIQRAIERASDADRLALAAAMASAADIDDADLMGRCTTDVRASFHALGGSPRFHALVRSLRRLVVGNFFELVQGSVENMRVGLPQVGEAVEASDPRAAIAAYEVLTERNASLVIQDLKDRSIIE